MIGFTPIKHTIFWYWFRLIVSSTWRMDYRLRYSDFWINLNHGWNHMEYVWRFEEFWGKGSYPPETIELSQSDFDSLVERLNQPPEYDEKVARVLLRKAPWGD